MKSFAVSLLLALLMACRKDKIALPVEFECHYGDLVFSADSNLNIPAFYPVAAGNWWTYCDFKYVNDTLDTSYHSSHSTIISGLLINSPDSLWEFNNNSNQIFGKSDYGIFYLQNSMGGCRVPSIYLNVPMLNDTLYSYESNPPYTFMTSYHYANDTLTTPAGTFYNPLIKTGGAYGDFFIYYFIKDIGMVKGIFWNLAYPGIRVERVLTSYHFN
ncbi:MAG TPA: hypothetical protein VD905_18560 [Flavobacteriales bacterium]|nr:hypothetical protein [Flavobacteriales bacterium]